MPVALAHRNPLRPHDLLEFLTAGGAKRPVAVAFASAADEQRERDLPRIDDRPPAIIIKRKPCPLPLGEGADGFDIAERKPPQVTPDRAQEGPDQAPAESRRQGGEATGIQVSLPFLPKNGLFHFGLHALFPNPLFLAAGIRQQ